MWLNKLSTIKRSPGKKENAGLDKSVKVTDSVIIPEVNEFTCVDSLPGFLRKKIEKKKN